MSRRMKVLLILLVTAGSVAAAFLQPAQEDAPREAADSIWCSAALPLAVGNGLCR